MDKDIEIAIAALEQGVADRQKVVAGLRDLEVTPRKGAPLAPKTTAGKTTATTVKADRRWTPERKKKYLATMARKKKEVAAAGKGKAA